MRAVVEALGVLRRPLRGALDLGLPVGRGIRATASARAARLCLAAVSGIGQARGKGEPFSAFMFGAIGYLLESSLFFAVVMGRSVVLDSSGAQGPDSLGASAGTV